MVNRIFLVGMPYAGKTYWGRLVAEHYNIRFTDLDEVVASYSRKSIEGIFAEQGEDFFRKVEHECLVKMLAEPPETTEIVACGGGTPCYYDNMERMCQAGAVVYLEATPEYLLTNRERSTAKRPLFDDSMPLAEQVNALLQRRKPYYLQAHYILPAADISVATFAKILNHV
ncbi:MAG: shikimate kinase [Taibaiella sp.]|nr:shikimate kinase [Taibaiella sp.]